MARDEHDHLDDHQNGDHGVVGSIAAYAVLSSRLSRLRFRASRVINMAEIVSVASPER